MPITNINDIIPILKLIEKDSNKADIVTNNKYLDELMTIVTDCGLSQTTLEEVFMIVTGKKEAKDKKALESNKSPNAKKHPPSPITNNYSPKKFEEVKGVDEDVTYHTNLENDSEPRNYKLNDSF